MKTLALLAGFLLAFALGVSAGCDDDWTLIAHCATGQAQHVNDELGCYAPDGSPVKFRAWMNDTPEQACAFCDGTEQPTDGGTR